MATTTEEIKLVIKSEVTKALSDLKKLEKGVGNTDKSSQKMGSSFSAAAGVIKMFAGAAVMGKLISSMSEAIDVASDLEETTNKFNVVFKDVSGEAEKMSQVLVESYGLSSVESKKLLSNTGDLLTGFGLTGKEALDLSMKTQELAVDLASFTNIQGGSKRASEALTKAFFGEREMLKELGVVIREDELNRRVTLEAGKKLTGQALLQAKAQMTLKMAMEQSKNAIGDMARSWDSYANVTRRLESRTTDLKAAVGKPMMDAFKNLKIALLDLTSAASPVAGFFKMLGEMAGNVINDLAGGLMAINSVVVAVKTTFMALKLGVSSVSEALGKLGAASANERAGLEQYITLMRQRELMDTRIKDLALKKFGLSKEENAQIDAKIEKIKSETEAAVQGNIAKTESKKQSLEDIKAAEQMYDEWTMEKDELEKEKLLEKYEFLKTMYTGHKEKLAAIDAAYSQRSNALETKEMQAKFQKINGYVQFVGQVASKVLQGVSNVISAISSRETAKLDRQHKMHSRFIDLFITDEEQKAKAQQILDYITAKKKAQLEYKAAVAHKALSIAQAIMNTAMSITMALTMPFPLNLIMAATNAAMGAVQIGLIASTPLPSQSVMMAEGGVIRGSSAGTTITAGERNMAEAIIPLENEDAMSKIGSMGNTYNIYFDGAILANENLPEDFINAIDKGMYKIEKRQGTMFAEAL